MAKDVIYPIISVLIVLIVAGGIYYLADSMGATGIHHEGEEGHEAGHEEEAAHPVENNEEAQAIFFAAMEKPLNYDSYVFAYTETASNGYRDSVSVSSNGRESYVMKEDAIFTRELFLGENQTVLCLENVNRRLCTEVDQNSTYNPYAYTLSALLLDKERINQNRETNQFLIEHGAIVFHPEMPTKTYGGTGCTEIYYTLDYSKLSVEEMRLIGMDPDSPEVLLSKEYNFSLCIEPETSDVIHKSLTYLNFGTPESMESLTTRSEWGGAVTIEMPANFSEDTDMAEFYEALRQSQENYANCLIDENFEGCIRTEAIHSRNEKLCELITDVDGRDACYLMVALEKGSPLICQHVSENFEADCYTEFAWKYKDTTYCGQIGDPAKQQECITAVTEPAEGEETIEEIDEEMEEEVVEEGEPAGAPSSAECSVDSDCAVAGCSSQMCVPKALSDIVTTCEYLPEYDCLSLTTCGCHGGECGWDQNQEYLKCLDEKTTE